MGVNKKLIMKLTRRQFIGKTTTAVIVGGLMARGKVFGANDRIRMCINAGGEGESWFISSGWNDRTETLFTLASEVSKKFGGKQSHMST